MLHESAICGLRFLSGIALDDVAELLYELGLDGGLILSFEGVEFVVVKFVFDGFGGICGAAPFHKSVTFSTDGPAKF
ncbi:MAG: hypothetical protein RL215_3121 [Planctomycetota bacterium]